MGAVLYDNGIVLIENDRQSDLIAVLYNNKWGFVDLSGNTVIPCKYEDTSILDADGSDQFDTARYYYVFQGGRAPFVKHGKVGLLDEKGNEVLPARYKHIELTGDNNAVDYPTATTFGGKQVLIDMDNRVVSKEYDEIEAVDQVFAVYKIGAKYGLISLPECKVITEAKYDGFDYPNEGFIRYEVNKKYGYIDKTGQEVFKAEFDDGASFYNGYCRIKKEGKYGYIKAYGYHGIYIDCEFEESRYIDENGIAIARKNGLYGAINTKKKVLIPFEFDEIRSVSDDGLYKVRKGKMYGFYNSRGQILIPCEFSEEMVEIERRLYMAQEVRSMGTTGGTSIHNEEMMVRSMGVAINDLTASMSGRKDLNDIPCSLVRVMLMDSDPKFEGNVAGSIDKRGMQYLVYMSAGSKYLRVVPADHFPIMVSFVDFGISSLESKKTYDLIIVENSK